MDRDKLARIRRLQRAGNHLGQISFDYPNLVKTITKYRFQLLSKGRITA